jgi:hypothetical protein
MTSPQTTVAATAVAVDFASHAQALQSILADLGTVTVQQVVTLFRKYADTPNFPTLLKQALPEIVTPHAHVAAEITAQWYQEINPASAFEAVPVVDLAPERLDKSINWALYAPGDATPMDRMAGSSKRMVSDAARDTVTVNAAQEGVRWARYASANACAFCRLLATRTDNNLYQSQTSATTVVGRRGTQKQGDKYHDHCRCIAVPVPDGQTYTPPDYTAQWQQDYLNARKDVRKQKMPQTAQNILASMRANTDAS